MTSTDPMLKHVIVAEAMWYLFRTGKAPEVGALVMRLGIRRREFYLHFRSGGDLHLTLVQGADDALLSLLGEVADSAEPVRQRIRAFLHLLMKNRMSCVPIRRPRGLETSLRDGMGRLFRGLLREAAASGEVSVTDVGRVERAVLEATDRFLDDLPVRFVHRPEDERDLTADELQVFEELFEAHWAAVSGLLPHHGATDEVSAEVPMGEEPHRHRVGTREGGPDGGPSRVPADTRGDRRAKGVRSSERPGSVVGPFPLAEPEAEGDPCDAGIVAHPGRHRAPTPRGRDERR